MLALYFFFRNDPDLYSVVMGEYDLNELSGKEVFRNVSRIEKHPFFDPLTFDYDVAVVEVGCASNCNLHLLFTVICCMEHIVTFL